MRGPPPTLREESGRHVRPQVTYGRYRGGHRQGQAVTLGQPTALSRLASLHAADARWSARRVGTLDDSGLYKATAAFAILTVGLLYLGLTS